MPELDVTKLPWSRRIAEKPPLAVPHWIPVLGAHLLRIRPDAMSVLGAVLCGIAGALLALGSPVWLTAVIFPLGAMCDVADGALARRASHERSPLGAFVDSLCDKLGEAAFLVGLLIWIGDDAVALLVVVAYTAGSLTSYVKAAAGEHGLGIDWPEARVYGRAGRAVLLSLTLALVAAMPGTAVTWLVVGFSLLAAFNVATLNWRIARVFRESPR